MCVYKPSVVFLGCRDIFRRIIRYFAKWREISLLIIGMATYVCVSKLLIGCVVVAYGLEYVGARCCE